MRLLTSILFAVLISLSSPAQSISDILKGITGSSSSTTSSSSSSSTTSSIISSIVGAVTGTTSTNLTGTWTYSGPAVSFESDNALLKIGGTAGASTIESKLAPYYTKLGMNNMTLTIAADSTFTMKFKKTTLTGTINYGSDNIVFNFKAANKINLGKMNASVSGLTSKTLKLTFDVSKLKQIMTVAASVGGSQISSLSSISSLLQQYDGIQAGFSLKKSS